MVSAQRPLPYELSLYSLINPPPTMNTSTFTPDDHLCSQAETAPQSDPFDGFLESFWNFA